MSNKIQASENDNETDNRDIQWQTTKFNGEPISALLYKNRKEHPKVFRQPSLTYPATLQKLPSSNSKRRKLCYYRKAGYT